MKVNLLLDEPAGVMPGWLNVDPLAPAGDEGRVNGDPANLSAFVDAGEVEELRALGVLDYLPRAVAQKAIEHWASLLAHGGLLAVSSLDLLEVSKSFQNRFISLEQASLLLYGQQEKAWQFRHCSHTALELSRLLEARGLVVLKRRVEHFFAVVVARRP